MTRTEAYDNHILLEREPQPQIRIKLRTAEVDSFANCIIHSRLAGTRHIVHIQTKTVANTMREEGSAYARCEDRLLRVP